VKRSEKAPILLFNEADAVFGVRKKGAEDAVDKMNNTIQNIILEEMESLEGIMIATTNLFDSNFDPAFERRFLYRIGFSRPGAEARTGIWRSLVKDLGESEAMTLAGEYDLSGGQIENISRKMTIDYILSGSAAGLDGIRELCRQELRSGDASVAGRIGFDLKAYSQKSVRS
jgi:ATPases of the AAA+ class